MRRRGDAGVAGEKKKGATVCGGRWVLLGVATAAAMRGGIGNELLNAAPSGMDEKGLVLGRKATEKVECEGVVLQRVRPRGGLLISCW